MKIEKCPFCGGEVKIDMLDSENSRNVKIYSAVHCPKCHERFFKGLSKEKTVAAWNRRADKDINVATNADRIRSISDEELAEWIDKMFNEGRDDWEPIGCYSCINYGTHHADKANIGTKEEYLYECKDCEFENGLLNWLQQPAETEGKK